MELKDAIVERRSIRKFIDKEIDNNIIDDLIYHGTLAPSAKNKQHWEYVVVRGEIKNKIGELLSNSDKGSVIVTSNVIKSAPVLILVYNNEPEDYFSGCSIGASIQNILLRATDLGIGSLWIGYVKKIESEIKELVGINKELISAISIGYQDEFPSSRPRKSLDEVRKYLN